MQSLCVLSVVVVMSATGCLFAPSFRGTGNGNGDGGDGDGGGGWTGTIMQTAYIKAQSVEPADRAGDAVALSGDGTTLVIGVPYADVGGLADAGRVYVYVQNAGTWQHQETLISSPEPEDWFGSSLALSSDGNWLAVGAWGDDGPGNIAAQAGAVHVFFRMGSTWGLAETLRAPIAGAGDGFGASLAMSSDGTTLLVGAPTEASASPTDQTNNDAAASGAVYMFTRQPSVTTWSLPTYLKSTTIAMNDRFGAAVAISGDGDTLAVGATGDDGPSGTLPESGAVHVLTRQGAWVETLRASNLGTNHSFGTTIALSRDGTTLVVSAPGEATTRGTRVGAAYLFRSASGSWSETQRITASNPDQDDRFGIGLALSRDGASALLGSPWESSSATDIDGNQDANDAQRAGAAYLFTAAPTLQQRAYIKASNTTANTKLGSDVAISDDGMTFVVGAPEEDGGSTGVNGNQAPTSSDTGAVYVFQVTP